MAAKRRHLPEGTAEEWQDPQEKLDELVGGEVRDADAFHKGSYAKSAQDAYEAKEKRRTREPHAEELRRHAALLAARVIKKASQA